MTNAVRSMRGLARILFFLTAGLATATVAAAQSAPGPAPTRNSYYRAGERIEVPAPVQGDVIAAGREVIVGHEVTGDVLAMGRTVTLRAPAHDDVRVAGGDVTLDAPIAGDITAAGRTVIIGQATHVEGRTWITGETIKADGVFDRDVRIAGGTVQIAGEMRQPVHVTAASLEILPGANVIGPITYEGPKPAVVSAGAMVASPITYRQTTNAGGGRPSFGTSLLFVLHLFVGGFLVYLLVPRFAQEPEEVMRREPVRSLAFGFALLVGVPAAALLLVITLIGLPVGLALGALYVVALFLGILTTAFFIGSMEARWFRGAPITTRGHQAKYLFAGVLTLAVLRALPVLGGLVIFLSVVFGLGALGLWVYRTYHATPLPMTA